MARKEAIEALDFIINVLREHEKDLSRLITELGKMVERFGEAGELTGKIQGVGEHLSIIQKEISDLVRLLPSPREIPVKYYGPPVIARCKQWEDFKVLAASAEIVSFLFKEAEKVFQTDALKESLILTYSGDFPKDFPQNRKSLKTWLSRELNIAEEKIFDGTLTSVQTENKGKYN